MHLLLDAEDHLLRFLEEIEALLVLDLLLKEIVSAGKEKLLDCLYKVEVRARG